MLAFKYNYFLSFSIHIIQLLIVALIAHFIIQIIKFDFSIIFRSLL